MAQKKPYALCLGKQLDRLLHEMAELDGRHVKNEALFLVEVMVSVANQQPRFGLKTEPQDHRVPGLGIKLQFSEELDDQLFHLGGAYGLDKQQLVRVLLWMGVGFYQVLVSPGTVLRKEEFVGLILESIRQPTLIN